MTLRELRRLHSDKFHPNQDWFEDEAFMDVKVTALRPPVAVVGFVSVPLVAAARLCGLYVKRPDLPIWSRYLWTSDTDRYGQRVYIGQNGKGLEIHRHIHLTERFGCPVWS